MIYPFFQLKKKRQVIILKCRVHGNSLKWLQYLLLLESVWLEEWKSRRIENGGRMEKWKDIKDFNFHFLFDWEWKSRGMKKMCLYKFTHVSLLKIIPY